MKAITKATPERGMWIRTDHKYNFKFCTKQFCGFVHRCQTARLYEHDTITAPSRPLDMESQHINALHRYILFIWLLTANLTTYVQILKEIQTSHFPPRTDTKTFQSTEKCRYLKVLYFYTA
jgi:hypothetical protein